MINIKILLGLVFTTLLFQDCKRETKPNLQQTIVEVKRKFPQLQNRELKFVRSIKIGSINSQIFLYATDKKDEKEKQELIIIENSNHDYYAIPFLSNTYRDYWSFKYDTLLTEIPATKTTFEKEFNTSMKKLSLTNNNLIANEIFVSLLHCEIVKESDSLNLATLSMVDNSNIKEEESSNCRIRLKNNWKDIYAAMRPNEYSIWRNSYFDESNHRVYLLPFTGNKDKTEEYKIKVYRQDCNIRLLNI